MTVVLNVRFRWVWQLKGFLSLGEAAITHFMIRLLLEYEKVSCGCNQDLVLYLVVFAAAERLRRFAVLKIVRSISPPPCTLFASDPCVSSRLGSSSTSFYRSFLQRLSASVETPIVEQDLRFPALLEEKMAVAT